MASLTSMLLTATLGGGGPQQPSQPLKMPEFLQCGAQEPEPQEKFVNAPPPKQGPLFLRMCILCGNDLAAGDITGTSDPYVDVRYGENSFCSPPQMNTLNPVWDYSFELEIQASRWPLRSNGFSGSPVRSSRCRASMDLRGLTGLDFCLQETGTLHFSVYDQDMGIQGDFLGSCQLLIPRRPSKLKKETLFLSSVPAPFFSKAPNSRITVFYHVVERLEDQPDLVHLARRMGEDGSEEKTPKNMTTEHSSMQDNMVAALRVAVGRQSSISQPGVADGLRYLYGPPSSGWQVEFSLKSVTLEDLVQLRIAVDWMLREGSVEEIQAARKQYIDACEASASEREGGRKSEAKRLTGKGRAAGTSAGQIDPLQDGARTPKKQTRLQVQKRESKDSDNRPTLQGYEKASSERHILLFDLALAREGRAAGRFITFGSWQLPLDEIREFCSERRICAWAGRCILTSKSGVKSGELLMHVDIFAEGEKPLPKVDIRRFPPPICTGSRVKPKKDGEAADSEVAPEPQGEDLTLYLHLYADFLPKTDVDYDARPWNDCDPFVVVKAHNVKGQKNVWTTNVQRNRQREVEWECMSIQVCRDSRRQRVVFEVFDSDTPFVFGSGILKQQIGMATLNRIPLNRPTWLHMFGGAPDGSREDYNSMMIKGALEPPSTYHGSLCVLADTKRTRRRDWPPFPERCGVAVHIQVAIGRALYLPDSYREREVNLLIQVPGCVLELPGRQSVAGGGMFARGWRPKPPTLTSRLNGVRKCREMSEIPSANADILEFPGYVDSKGVLRVYNWSGPRKTMHHDTATYCKNNDRPSTREYSDHDAGSQLAHRLRPDGFDLPISLLNAWVLRESERVFLLPQVQWAFIYVVPVGEEDTPPKIFGRIPLQLSKGTKDAFDKQGVRAETNEWPPPEACDFEHSDNEQKLDLVVKAKEEAEAKVPHHPAITPSSRNACEADPMQINAVSEEPDESADIEPLKWIQLHWDQSVTPLPECRFPSTFAACLLVSARAVLGHPISFTDRDAAFVYGSESSVGDYGKERDAESREVDEDTESSNAKTLAVENEVPRPEVSTVLCGLDTLQRRCGHAGKMVLSESLFSVSRPVWQPEQLSSDGPHQGEGEGLDAAPSLKVSPFYKRVYFHADVLQARSLPAMDNDALVNPWWIIEVEDEVIKMVDEGLIDREMRCLKSSLNPAFLNRTAAPVYLYLSPGRNARELTASDGIPSFEQLFLPVPPVLLRLFDIDIGKKGEVVKEMMAVVVDWDPANLDSRFKAYSRDLAAIEHSHVSSGVVKGVQAMADRDVECAGSRTDVNYAHEAVWYSLVNNEQIRFSTAERSVAQSLEWDTRPRLLGAFGFALSGINEGMKKHLEDAHRTTLLTSTADPHELIGCDPSAVSWPVLALDSLDVVQTTKCKLLRYHFDVDILGIRFVTTERAEQTSDLLLQLSAFWQGRSTGLQLILSPCDSSGPNVVALLSEKEPETRKRQFVEVLDVKDGKMSRQVLLPKRHNTECSTGPGHWVGARVSTCSFVTPYLPYIQHSPALEKKQKKFEGQDREDSTVPTAAASSATTAQGDTTDSDDHSDSYVESFSGQPSSVGTGIMQKVGVKAVLPDVCCRLVSREGTEIATLSLPLNSFVKVPQGERCLKLQLDSPLLAGLPPPMMDMSMMDQRTMPTLPFLNTVDLDVFIECFSEHTGDLIYDSDCRAGRVLTDHDMFFVRDYAGEVHTHILNADDHFVGYEDKINVPFVEPVLWVDLKDPGPTTAEYKHFYEVTRRTRVKPGAPRAGTSRIGLYVSKTFQNDKKEEFAKKKEYERFGSNDEDRVQFATRTWIRKRNHEASLEDEWYAFLNLQRCCSAIHRPLICSLPKSFLECLKLLITSALSRTPSACLFPGHCSTCLLARLMILRSEYYEEEDLEGGTFLTEQWQRRRLLPTFNMINIFTKKDGKHHAQQRMQSSGSDGNFGRAGDLLLIFRTAADKQYHRVCVPSLDIRHAFENGYYFYDTMTESFTDFHKICVEQKLQRLKLQMRGREKDNQAGLQLVKQADQQQLEVEILELEAELSKLEATSGGYRRDSIYGNKAGFSYAIPVQRGELVCRLKKTCNYFDRNQTVHWFDSYSLLPSINLDQPMVWGEEKKKIAFLKGWVRVTDVTMMETRPLSAPMSITDGPEESSQTRALALREDVHHLRQPQQHPGSARSSRATSPSLGTSGWSSGYPPPAVIIAPPMHHWLVEVVVVHVYVLTARNLQNVDTLGSSDPYLKVQLGQQQVISETVFDNNCNPNFYEHFVFRVLIPGAATLKIIVMDKGDMIQSDSSLGMVAIDLEERWLTLKSSRISEYQKDCPVIGSGKKHYLPPVRYFPIEFRPLSKGENEDLAISQGTLRYFVDMHVDSDPYEELPISSLGTQTEFELRVIIWRVENITVFKGSSGERNDLKVRVEIFLTDFDLADTSECFDTDVHFFSRKKATFNWRITKRVKLPLASISVKLTLVDVNAPVDDNALYGSELLSLDAFALTAMSRYRQDQSVIAPVDFAVEFDDPLGAGMVEHWCQAFWCAPYEALGCPASVTGCCNRREVRGNFMEDRDDSVALCCCLDYCCCGRSGKRRRMGVRTYRPATLHCTVALVPKNEADARPVGFGRAAPEPLAEPTDRPSPNMMFTGNLNGMLCLDDPADACWHGNDHRHRHPGVATSLHLVTLKAVSLPE
ncbi:hypothetical protein Efla_004087 [Eimeria flavescens]